MSFINIAPFVGAVSGFVSPNNIYWRTLVAWQPQAILLLIVYLLLALAAYLLLCIERCACVYVKECVCVYIKMIEIKNEYYHTLGVYVNLKIIGEQTIFLISQICAKITFCAIFLSLSLSIKFSFWLWDLFYV